MKRLINAAVNFLHYWPIKRIKMSLSGTHNRTNKRQLTDGDEEDGPGGKKSLSSSVISALAASEGKEVIPAIFKSSAIGGGRFLQKGRSGGVSSEHILKPEELEEFKRIPCDTEAALLTLKGNFPVGIFEGRLPPVFLYSQLGSLVKSRAVIDHQLKKLAGENKILTFSQFSSTNYLIVFYEDFVKLERKGLFQRFVNDVLGEEEVGGGGVKRSPENSKLVSKESLLKKWKFEENEVRQLVNSGYLGVMEGGFYCVSLPGAGEFMKVYEKGKKTVMNSIRKAKFGEILQKDLEQRPMKKAAPLGVPYHVYDLLGTGEVVKVDTTSGALLRIKRELQPQ